VVTFELLLPIGAVGFYLFDSAALLYGNEFIFTLHSDRWTCSEGSDLILRGRRLYLPNPFTPQRLSFRISWSELKLDEPAGDVAKILALRRNLRPLAILDQLLLILIVFAMPAVIAFLGTGAALLAVFGACYLVALVLIGLLYRRRSHLGLTTRQLLGLSLDSVLCPPFAINLVRKIALHQSLVGDPVAFAKVNFAPQDFADLVAAIFKRLDLDMGELDRAEEQWAQLQAYREHLMSISK
jgi:hypothetical protein